MDTILSIRNLKKHYPVIGGVFRKKIAAVRAVDGIDLDIRRGECLGIVGESGCGKTTTGKAVVRLHAPTSGRVLYYPADIAGNSQNGIDITAIPNRRMKKAGIRGKLQMVFQDPTTSLNPRMLVKHIVAEPIKAQIRLSIKEIEKQVLDLLLMVGLTGDHMLRYPHEFSGGQRQRIAVARAIATNPEFIVLDEPTSALDVSVQAQILNLLTSIRKRLNLTYLFVTHHLLVVKYISQRLAVMYLGKIVELAPTDTLFKKPLHPYTQSLLSGIPIPEVCDRPGRIVLAGDVPSPVLPPPGCRFHTRCPFAMKMCREREPVLETVGDHHLAACHRLWEMDYVFKKKFGDLSDYFSALGT